MKKTTKEISDYETAKAIYSKMYLNNLGKEGNLQDNVIIPSMIAYASQQPVSEVSRETVEKMLEALKKLKEGMMNLIEYNILPDRYCPDANELIDLGFHAIQQAEKEIKQ